MKERKVISIKNQPAKLPIWTSIVAWLALDYFSAPEWLIGAVGLFFLIGWITIIAVKISEKQIDIFEEPIPKSGFKERLEELQNKNK